MHVPIAQVAAFVLGTITFFWLILFSKTLSTDANLAVLTRDPCPRGKSARYPQSQLATTLPTVSGSLLVAPFVHIWSRLQLLRRAAPTHLRRLKTAVVTGLPIFFATCGGMSFMIHT